MREPSAEEIVAAKASAKELSGSDAIELVPFPDLGAEGFAVLLRRLTPAEYGAYLDTGLRAEQDAREAAFLDACVWPSRREAQELVRAFPGLVNDTQAVLDELAGLTDTSAKRVSKLSASTPASVLDAASLPKDIAAELLARFHHPGQLTLVAFPTLDEAFVLKSPGSLYAPAVARITAAKDARSGYRAAAITSVAGVVVWSKRPFEDACARWPALPGAALISAFLKLGGTGAAGTRKSL